MTPRWVSRSAPACPRGGRSCSPCPTDYPHPGQNPGHHRPWTDAPREAAAHPASQARQGAPPAAVNPDRTADPRAAPQAPHPDAAPGHAPAAPDPHPHGQAPDQAEPVTATPAPDPPPAAAAAHHPQDALSSPAEVTRMEPPEEPHHSAPTPPNPTTSPHHHPQRPGPGWRSHLGRRRAGLADHLYARRAQCPSPGECRMSPVAKHDLAEGCANRKAIPARCPQGTQASRQTPGTAAPVRPASSMSTAGRRTPVDEEPPPLPGGPPRLRVGSPWVRLPGTSPATPVQVSPSC